MTDIREVIARAIEPGAFSPVADALMPNLAKRDQAKARKLANAALSALSAAGLAVVPQLLLMEAGLCLSGFVGEGISVTDYPEPDDVYLKIAEVLGVADEEPEEVWRSALAAAVGRQGK